jgi:hypothetical protein
MSFFPVFVFEQVDYNARKGITLYQVDWQGRAQVDYGGAAMERSSTISANSWWNTSKSLAFC